MHAGKAALCSIHSTQSTFDYDVPVRAWQGPGKGPLLGGCAAAQPYPPCLPPPAGTAPDSCQLCMPAWQGGSIGSSSGCLQHSELHARLAPLCRPETSHHLSQALRQVEGPQGGGNGARGGRRERQGGQRLVEARGPRGRGFPIAVV